MPPPLDDKQRAACDAIRSHNVSATDESIRSCRDLLPVYESSFKHFVLKQESAERFETQLRRCEEALSASLDKGAANPSSSCSTGRLLLRCPCPCSSGG